MKTSSRTDYLRRIDRVVEKLSASIERGEPLPSIAELAAYAHLSEFHFMRVYRALAGEALGTAIQRLRLQRAVHLLKHTNKPVTEIAACIGYETPQAFARAFRQRFAAAPTDVRERPQVALTPTALNRSRASVRSAEFAPPCAAPQERDHADTIEAPGGAAPAPVIRVEIVQLAPFRVAALRNYGAYADLDKAYVRLVGWIAAQDALDSVRGVWGMPHHDRRDTPPEESVFDCCLATEAQLAASAGVRLDTIGGGRYVVYRHVGSYTLLDGAHDVLLRDVLPDAKLTLRDAPILHHFINEPDGAPESELETHIYIPIDREESC
jgi:AraC family transcriptional regulator